ncbi:MAG TPA: hypothetical protein VNH42_04540 [Mariprofundaceae bacterium]|nr:hypothetical protein [Mariprofundaceae bacterium]
MLTFTFVMLSIPIGVFCAWFAYRAFRIGRRSTAITFSGLALVCFATAGLVGGWIALVLHHS